MSKYIKPLGQWILIEESKDEHKKSLNGLHLKENMDMRLVQGLVESTAEAIPEKFVKHGQRVIMPRDGVLSVELFGRRYVFTKPDMILGTIEDGVIDSTVEEDSNSAEFGDDCDILNCPTITTDTKGIDSIIPKKHIDITT